MANTKEELKQSLAIFEGRSPRDQIRADEVKDHTGKIINSMVQLIEHRDSISLFIYNPTRTLAYVKDEVVVFESNFYKALVNGILGTFDPTKWELINLINSAAMGGDSFIRSLPGNDFVAGDLTYFDGTTYLKAIANNQALVNDTYALFIVKDVDGANVTFGTSGALVEADLGFSNPSVLFLSDVIAGVSVENRPNTEPIQQVGFYADGIFHFNPVPIKIEEEVPFKNESLTLNGNILQLTDTVGTISIDLSPFKPEDPTCFIRTVVGNSFTVGELIYFDGANYLRARADEFAVEDDAFALFIVKEVEGDEVSFGVSGAVLELDLTFNSATPVLYLSDTNSGELTEVRPLTEPVQQIGFYADGVLHFNPVPIILSEGNGIGSGTNTFARTIPGNTFAIGEMIYFDGVSYLKALANQQAVEADSFAIFVVVNLDGDNVYFGTPGAVVEIDLGLTGAPVLFLSETTPGQVSAVEPSQMPYQQVGFYADGLLHFNPIPVTQGTSSGGGGQSGFSRNIPSHTFAVGDMVYFDGSNYEKAIADDEALMNDSFAVLAVQEVKGDDIFFVTPGAVLEVDFNLSGSSILYLSDIDSGELTTTKPTTVPYQQVGFFGDGLLHFNPVPVRIEETNSGSNESLVLTESILSLRDDAGTLNVDLSSLNDGNSFIKELPGNTFAMGDLAYFNGTTYAKALAIPNPIVGGIDSYALFIVRNVNGDQITFGTPGSLARINLPIAGVADLYLSDTVAGVATNTVPTTLPVQKVGVYADGVFHFSPQAASNGSVNPISKEIKSFDFALRDQIQNGSFGLAKVGSSFKQTTSINSNTLSDNQLDPFIIPKDGVVKSLSVFFSKIGINTGGQTLAPVVVLKLSLYKQDGSTSRILLDTYDIPVDTAGIDTSGNLNSVNIQTLELPVPKANPSDPDTAFTAPLETVVEKFDAIGLEFTGTNQSTSVITSIGGLQVSMEVEFN